jgi:hypothetical protein
MATTTYDPLSLLELDERGKLKPLTADQCMTIFTTWANDHPCARFAVVVLAPDGTDGEVLGWGLAHPDHVFVHLPEVGLQGRFDTAGNVLTLLRLTMDARIIWVDPEPDHWPDEGCDE